MGRDPKGKKALIEIVDRRIELMFFIQSPAGSRNAHTAMAAAGGAA